MSDEPLYCTQCGAEWGDCDCPDDDLGGIYCHTCAGLRDPGARCVYCEPHRRGGYLCRTAHGVDDDPMAHEWSGKVPEPAH